MIVYPENKGITLKVQDKKLIGADILIYNGLGQNVINKKLSSPVMHIDCLFVPDVYLVKVNNITRKLIIK
jgi:hypothetical protein